MSMYPMVMAMAIVALVVGRGASTGRPAGWGQAMAADATALAMIGMIWAAWAGRCVILTPPAAGAGIQDKRASRSKIFQ
jgi:hypothetical protein